MNKPVMIIEIIVILGIVALFMGKSALDGQLFTQTINVSTSDNADINPPAIKLEGSPTPKQSAQQFDIVAEELNVPWELVFLPTDEMLVTERPGRLLKIGQNRTPIEIQGVAHVGEGGLLGLTIHPKFSQNSFIYLYLTTRAGNVLTNRVERYRYLENRLQDRVVILENIPGSQIHDGGRIAFGPDEKLYITTGDASVESNAQNRESLAGKILRVNDDGSIPDDNPFNTAIWTYGHRNPQGLAWDENGNLWATEHGRSGITSGYDEVNLIERGKNYGWPKVQGDDSLPGMETPKANSGARETWAPSGAAIIGNNLFFTGLRGESLYKTKINVMSLGNVTAHFTNQFGRLRTVAEGPDEQLYLLTNNRDGRGSIKEDDDKIIKINPKIIE